MLSLTEENYLKTIFSLSYPNDTVVGTNEIAKSLTVNPASVTDMLKKLYHKEMIDYIKYQGVKLTKIGKDKAIDIVRKHRIWEYFLVDKLNFSWDEVHDIAEQLEHIDSPLLITRLYDFLGNPPFDPHGEPIPNEAGVLTEISENINLESCLKQQKIKVTKIIDDSATLLQYLTKIHIGLGSVIEILEVNDYDKSMEVIINNEKNIILSWEITKKIYGIYC
ncbi:MAG: metal-dependent transcriptional regulator [Thermonemataceae bacterium]|nr:metal-dependent transcriptional regulator [Thermonemataceae bacterium]